jgi:predicted RNase H-like HicB family nuclease
MDIIPVIYHREPEGWWADAPAVEGWTATAQTLDELRALVEEGVRFALERDDVLVDHVLYELPNYAPIVFDFATGETLRGGDLSAPPARLPRHLQTA